MPLFYFLFFGVCIFFTHMPFESVAKNQSVQSTDLQFETAENNLPCQLKYNQNKSFEEMGLVCNVSEAVFAQHRLKNKILSPVKSEYFSRQLLKAHSLNFLAVFVGSVPLANYVIHGDNTALNDPVMSILTLAAVGAGLSAMSINMYTAKSDKWLTDPPTRLFWAPLKKRSYITETLATMDEEDRQLVKSVMQGKVAVDSLDLQKTYTPYKYNFLQLMIVDRKQNLIEQALTHNKNHDYKYYKNFNNDTAFSLAIDKGDFNAFKSIYMHNTAASLTSYNHIYKHHLHQLQKVKSILSRLNSALRIRNWLLSIIEKNKLIEMHVNATNLSQQTSSMSQLDNMNPSDGSQLHVGQGFNRPLQYLVAVMALENEDSNEVLLQILPLVMKADLVNQTDQFNNTILHHAIVSGNLRAVEMLLGDLTVRIDVKNDWQISARHLLQNYVLQLKKISSFLAAQIEEQQQLQAMGFKKVNKLNQSNLNLCAQLLGRLQK